MDERAYSIESLLELSDRHEREGLGDAPWPPHYRKQTGEPPRVQPSRRRQPKHPLIEVARAERKADALARLDAWKARYPDAAAQLAPADVLVDAMRGRFHTWTRIRINLQHVPEAIRPAQEPIESDPTIAGWPADASHLSARSTTSARPERRTPFVELRAKVRTPSRASS